MTHIRVTILTFGALNDLYRSLISRSLIRTGINRKLILGMNRRPSNMGTD